MAGWYAVQTKPHREDVAAENLEAQDFEVLIPRMWGRRKLHGAVMPVPVPLFRQFLFARVDLDDRRWRAINSTRGVKGILQLGGERPVAIPDMVMLELQRRCMEGPIEDTAGALRPFLVGEPVVVTEGPFTSSEGIVKEVTRKRVLVLLSVLGRQSVVYLDPSSITRAS